MSDLVERAVTRLQWYAPLGDQDKFEADVRAVVDLVLEEAARAGLVAAMERAGKFHDASGLPAGSGEPVAVLCDARASGAIEGGKAAFAAIRSLSSKGGE